jgi:DNA modification methylase
MAQSWRDQLHVGCCIEQLKRFKEPHVDLAFADPPYNIGYSYDVYRDNLESTAYLGWTKEWMEAVYASLKPTGTFWLAIGDEYAAELKCGAEQVGFHLRNWVIWYYTFGVHCTKKFSRSHTHLLYFVKEPRDFTFNDDQIRVKSARQLVYNDLRAEPSGRVPDNTWLLRPQDVQEGFQREQDTWYFARVAGTFKERAGFHTCQMPERLLERIIRSCSNPDDVVLDPFAGSGSTLVVAKKLGRHWLGYDISPEYVRLAGARINSVRAGDAIKGTEDPLTSAPSTFARRQKQAKPDSAAIMEAFQSAADGYSADRVVADPVLNAAFIEQCSKRSLPGRPQDWNLSLFALRKQGKLQSTKITRLDWDALDEFEFASEMALRRMLDLGFPSVDCVLCDPTAALRFDIFARSIAPGFTSLQYRWAALKLRKSAKLWREYSEKSDIKALPRRTLLELDDNALAQVSATPAVYFLLSGQGKEFNLAYIGETGDVCERTRRMLSARPGFDQLVPNNGSWRIELFDLQGTERERRRGLQSCLIAQHRPPMNYLELAAETS